MEQVVELVALGAMTIPLMRVSFDPGVRRRFDAFPGVRRAMIASIVVYLATIAAIALFVPTGLRILVVLSVIAIIVERWQARAAFGRTRGLPPGSLALLPVGPWRNPRYYLEQTVEHGPTFKFRHFIFPAVGIASLEKAGEFLRSNEDNLVVPAAPFSNVVPGGFVRYMSQERHESIASMLRSALSPAVIEAAQPVFEAESRAAIESLAAAPSSTPFPAVDRFARNVMMRCFFGITDADQIERIDALFRAADYRRLAATGRRRAGAALFAIVHEVRRLAARDGEYARAACPSFLSELARAHPDVIDDDGVIGNFIYMLHTGRLDAAGLLAWVIAQLADSPEWVAKLAVALESDREAAVRPGGLADRMVRETLRLHQSEFILRRVRRRIHWGEFEIPSGWYVRICVQESHRSPEVFENPDDFNPDRFLVTPGRARYAPFGIAPRSCPGEHFSRALGVHLVSALASRYVLRVAQRAPEEFSGFHWRPGPEFKVGLTPLT